MAERSRLDVIEERMEELSRHWNRLFGEIGRLDHKIDAITTASIFLCTSIPAIRYGIGVSWPERSACQHYVTQGLRLGPHPP